MKVLKPIIEHTTHSEILMELSFENLNSTQLSKIMNKNQSGIHQQIIYLKKNDWIKKLKKKEHESPVNFDKLTDEFIKYCDSDEMFSNIEIHHLNFEIKEVIKVLFEIAVIDDWKNKLGNKLTIKYIFNIIKQDIFIDYLKQKYEVVF